MSFLRRLLGRQPADTEVAEGEAGAPEADVDEAELGHERDLLAAEEERLDDLQRRQIRYAGLAWTPPPQGGTRRADDADRTGDETAPEH